jgi:isopenicillin N synthase-like dioxygenase
VEIRELCVRLLEHIAAALGLAPARLNGMFGEAVQAVRMNFYPPCPRPELVLGLSPHSDGSAVTVLQQDAAFAGLQVLRGGGGWVAVHPVPGALVVNVGDTLEVLTNGRYKSVEHRVTVSAAEERLSLAFFYNPRSDLPLAPMPELVAPPARPALYPPMTFDEYREHIRRCGLSGKAQLQSQQMATAICGAPPAATASSSSSSSASSLAR